MFLEVMKNQDYMPLDSSSVNVEKDLLSNAPIERRGTFAIDALGRNPEKNVTVLYKAQKYLSKQDGIRFRSEEDLNRHLNLLFTKNSEKKGRLAGRICRLLYDRAHNWINDTSKIEEVLSHGELSREGSNSNLDD